MKGKEKGHKFSTKSFKKFTWCEMCNDFIWGLARQGYQCQVCRMPVHRKCMDKANSTTNCQSVLTSETRASKFSEWTDSKKISTLSQLLNQIQAEDHIETSRLQLFVSLIASLSTTVAGQTYLSTHNPIQTIRGKSIMDTKEEDDTSKDTFAVLTSFFQWYYLLSLFSLFLDKQPIGSICPFTSF
eukprot:TRINITY_DN834_c0_g1_i1.p1 TRINITY_DN834_c0_g1~~TRINITY_DN834_c0_g1_i1.p1  ORF type:complete len:185 (+),score=35.23 TRINITY_DN834_c0_g1_i1:440-994(+)